jgi:PAS domain S-box-containing protein
MEPKGSQGVTVAIKKEQAFLDHKNAQRTSNNKKLTKEANDVSRFFELSLDMMCIADLETGYFSKLNAAWTDRLGWHVDELTARPFIEFVHPDDHERTQAEVNRLIAGEKTIMFENRWRHFDGTCKWLQWNAHLSDSGQVVYAAARDVTDQKRLEREIIEILDNERTRVGQDLHDGLCQNLAGIAALSSRLTRSLKSESESAAAARASEITGLLHDSIREARDLARGLGPAGLNDSELDELLEDLLQNFRRQFEASFVLNCDCPVAGLDDDVKAHLFRIAQEACHNSVIHGQADQIVIGLGADHGQLVMSIRDDGIGMPEKIRKSDGIGMHTMAYRAATVGGSFEIRHRNGGGTAVVCTLPLPQAAGVD